MTKPTEEDMESLPHITMTSDEEWNPAVLAEEWDEKVFQEATEYKPEKDINIEYREEFTPH